MMVLSVRMMLMVIPMKPVMMTMVTISPLQEGIPTADFSLPESFFSLYGFRPRGGSGIFLRSVPHDF